ncbi:precorrin-6y C5,15-methyltransferase (decarboxylating) subunit CbiE [Rhodovulum sp. DZ06]|uniref:precorrin-6y C5,15-methyltransferase (decarboxylating) subunit CbiE n=1 Tax=Rhodovulum sp. DZ06 TaxID=3425126 RepID=UPI003D32C0E8
MSEPWLTIVGMGEDGPDGLPPASRAALDAAEVIVAPPRHLSLLPELSAERVEWPVPFVDGLALLEGFRGRRTVALASGDPFWFGAGSVIARRLGRAEWRAIPGPSSFALAAARLAWPLERCTVLGLHAAPLARLRPHLHPGARILCTLREGASVEALCETLCDAGFGASRIHALQALGGPREKIREGVAETFDAAGIAHPVLAAIEVAGPGEPIPLASGRPDALFANDGQITKRPVRALTLSALAPRQGERLWDIGGGSGSIAIEWLLAHPTLQAVSVEPRADRAERIAANAAALGVDRLQVVHGAAPAALADLPAPDVVFVGGGLSAELLDTLVALPKGVRLVINAVTLESEAALAAAHAAHGGELLRIELARAAPIGPKRGWKSSYPVVQWSVTL